MFNTWRINRLKRKIAILESKLENLNSIFSGGGATSYYVDEGLSVSEELIGLKFDLRKLEDKE